MASTTALLVSCGAARVWAEEAPPPQAALTWLRLSGAQACPGPADLARRVDALLKRSAFVGPASATRFFQVSIQPNVDGLGWRLSIVVSDEVGAALGTRDLSVSQAACGDAVDAAALALALMIDPNFSEAKVSPPARAPAPPTPTTRVVPQMPSSEPTAPRVAREAVSPPPPAPPAESHWRTRLGLALLSEAGALPHTSSGALAGVRLSPVASSIGVNVGAGYLGQQRKEVRAGAGVEVNAIFGGLGIWVAPWARGNLDFSLAAGTQVRRTTACGFGFTSTNGCQTSLRLGATVDAELALRLVGHWGVSVRPGVELPFGRDTFQTTGSNGSAGNVFRASSVVGWLALGVVVEP